MQKAMELAFSLDSGMVHLNDCTVSDEAHAPFGGVRNSGFGREGGRFSMEEMTELKWITSQTAYRCEQTGGDCPVSTSSNLTQA